MLNNFVWLTQRWQHARHWLNTGSGDYYYYFMLLQVEVLKEDMCYKDSQLWVGFSSPRSHTENIRPGKEDLQR